jgi:membrane protease YdiL (CAAX protease family)
VAAAELLAASIVVLLDLFIPTIIILALMTISLVVRRDGLASIGLRKPERIGPMLLYIFGAVLVWTLLQLGLFMPILEHLTGMKQDVSAFADLQGNLPQLLLFLAFTWTLAAFGEEMVYRGYMQRRATDVLGAGRAGLAAGIGLSSVLFGLAHTEQGIIGVGLTTLDALFFSWLKLRVENNLWAPILAHGVSNTIGLTAYYLVGPISGLW